MWKSVITPLVFSTKKALVFSTKKALLFQFIQKAYKTSRVNVFDKRGSMLSGLVGPKKLSKKTHYETINVNPKKKFGMFDKVSRPSRRERVLNSTFIEAITDVLSIGDVAPEVMGLGIEITHVKITPDYRTLNIYWEIPLTKLAEAADIEAVLAHRAPRIRAEMISRNVVGKVPHFFFVRNEKNAHLAAFEKALAEADMGPKQLSTFVPDKDFMKDIYKFEKARIEKNAKLGVLEKPRKEMFKDLTIPPPKPVDMKTDILGLDQAVLMSRVLSLKRKDNFEKQPAAQSTKDDDLFSKIPGEPLHQDVDRNALLKQFCVTRKKEMEEMRKSAEQDFIDDKSYGNLPNELYDNVDVNFEPDAFDDEEYMFRKDDLKEN